jgi:hypothetical protein
LVEKGGQVKDPVIGEEYWEKMKRRAFSRAFADAHNHYDGWYWAMLQDDARKASYHWSRLIAAGVDAMDACGMDLTEGSKRWHEGEE